MFSFKTCAFWYKGTPSALGPRCLALPPTDASRTRFADPLPVPSYSLAPGPELAGKKGMRA